MRLSAPRRIMVLDCIHYHDSYFYDSRRMFDEIR